MKVPERGVYRHYKGGLYVVVGVARSSEDWYGPRDVIYHPAGHPHDLIHRPLSMWNEQVNGVPRFQHLPDHESPEQTVAAMQEELARLRASFDLRRRADMRAIKLWQERTGRDMEWPDHADLVVFLREEHDRRVTELLNACNREVERRRALKASLERAVGEGRDAA